MHAYHCCHLYPKNISYLSCFFLGSELIEMDPVKQTVITRWSIDCIKQYIKISNKPFTVTLIFDVMKCDNRQRTFVMEFADAQVKQRIPNYSEFLSFS